MNRKRKGFTMVELLVVVAIMGILTVITVSQFSTAKRKSRDVQRKGDLSSVSKALMMWYADYGTFPPAANINVLWGGGEFADAASPPYVYMKTMPRETIDAEIGYCYAVSSDRKKFGLFSALENDQDLEYHKYSPSGYGNFNNAEVDSNGCENGTYDYATFSPNTSYDSADNSFQ